MNYKSFTVGEVMAKCYIISENDNAFIIDPGAEGKKIYKYLTDNNLKLKFIINTHGHFDHISANKYLKEKTEAEIYAHPKANLKFENPQKNLSQFFINKKIKSPSLDRGLADNEEIEFGTLSLKILYTPGHSEDGISVYIKEKDLLFSGDTIFANSIGRSDLNDSDFKLLKNSIENKLLLLPEKTKFLPGHGPESTIGNFKNNVWPLLKTRFDI